ncbi:glycoside hydrolase family 10 protein [Paenibacillus sp. GXUN7292]|uniref:glycoside hydrolase family 10 protein n=1 Tax=Paenibacillus sp. GXUN7292 TaxID=3422499 RepID=UPI003D7DAB44
MAIRKGKLMRFGLILLVICFVMPMYAPAASAANTPFETEVIVRTVNQFKNAADVTTFINKAVQYNVDVINLNVKQDEDDEVPSGYVFYDSDIAPIAPGYATFDALQHVITAAHANNIKVRAWIPQFHDQAAFNFNPGWQMYSLVGGVAKPFKGSGGDEYFVNPIHPDVQAYQRSIISEVVSNYDVDGVVLDWLRFDDYNMDVSSYTVNLYQSLYGYSPLTINFATDSTRRQEWNAWRTDKIGQYVADVRDDIEAVKPGLELGVYILPPEFTEVGQDVSKFHESIDFVAPMAYFDDWGFTPDWVYGTNGILADTADLAGSAVRIVPALDDDWTTAQYNQVYGGIRDNYPNVTHLSFFSYGAWSDTTLSQINTRRTWPDNGEYDAALPAGWKARNIGLTAGTASYSSGDFTLTSKSSDIWGTQDKLNFIYQTMTGDGTIVAKVNAMSNMNSWAKAGVMMRDTLNPSAKHADMLMTPSNGATFQYRSATGGSMTDVLSSASVPRWVKLERSGNQFIGYISSNGTSWTEVSRKTIAMNSSVYVGIALSNPGSSSSNKAMFSQVQIY